MPESAPPSAGSACSSSDDIPAGASPAQAQAIRHFRGPCEVLAGPGSGKTYVLVQRILYLIRECGIDPSHILVLTFSRSAALEMQQRFHKKSLPAHYEVTFGTFHSVFYHILRDSSRHPISLITSERSSGLISDLITRHLHRPPGGDEVRDVSFMIARAKANGRMPPEGNLKSIDNFRRIYDDYNVYLAENHLIDFEDMIAACRELLRESPSALKKWQERFPYIMIDEFQDINALQFDVIRMLAGREHNLFVVGDDDQSIYGFRGSDPSFMMDFSAIYPDTYRVDLDINYRCLPQIVSMSQKVIHDNTIRLEKPVRPARNGVQGVSLKEFPDMGREYEWLCLKLRELGTEDAGRSAVILRTHAQMTAVIAAFDRSGIVFQGAGGTAPTAEPMIAEAYEVVRGYFRLSRGLAAGRMSRRDLFRVMNRPERYLLRQSFRKEFYTEQELCGIFEPESPSAGAMCTLCRDLKMLRRLTPPMAVRYLERVIGFHTHSRRLDEALTALAESCSDTAELTERLVRTEAAALLSLRPGPPQGTHLITMHAAKGLEFDTVFLPDLNEGLLPSRRSRTPEAIEEERRLFYVAMTRARDQLYLMYLRGTKNNPRLPCRFLHPLGVQDWLD